MESLTGANKTLVNYCLKKLIELKFYKKKVVIINKQKTYTRDIIQGDAKREQKELCSVSVEIKCISQVRKKEENNNMNRSKKYNIGVNCIIMYTYQNM